MLPLGSGICWSAGRRVIPPGRVAGKNPALRRGRRALSRVRRKVAPPCARRQKFGVLPALPALIPPKSRGLPGSSCRTRTAAAARVFSVRSGQMLLLSAARSRPELLPLRPGLSGLWSRGLPCSGSGPDFCFPTGLPPLSGFFLCAPAKRPCFPRPGQIRSVFLNRGFSGPSAFRSGPECSWRPDPAPCTAGRTCPAWGAFWWSGTA